MNIIPAQIGCRIEDIDTPALILDLDAFDRNLLTSGEGKLARRMALSLTVMEKHLYLSVGEESITGVIERVELAN